MGVIKVERKGGETHVKVDTRRLPEDVRRLPSLPPVSGEKWRAAQALFERIKELREGGESWQTAAYKALEEAGRG